MKFEQICENLLTSEKNAKLTDVRRIGIFKIYELYEIAVKYINIRLRSIKEIKELLDSGWNNSLIKDYITQSK